MSNLERTYVGFLSGVVINNKILFSCANFNGLFECDIETGKIDFIKSFDGIENKTGIHFSDAILFCREIYFFPGNSRSVSIYNLDTGDMECIGVPDIEVDFLTSVAFVMHDVICFISAVKGIGVWMIDTKTKEIHKNADLSEMLESKLNYKYISGNKQGKQLFLGFVGTSSFVELHIDKGDYIIKTIPREDITIRDIDFDGDSYWILTDEKDQVIRWDVKSNEILECTSLIKNNTIMNQEGLLYGRIVCENSDVFVMNHFSDNILKVDKEKNELVLAFPELNNYRFVHGNMYKDGWGTNHRILKFGEKIIISPLLENELIMIDTVSGNVQEIDMLFEGVSAHRNNDTTGVYTEKGFYPLKKFIYEVTSERESLL